MWEYYFAQRHCRLKHSGDVRVVIGLKEGGTMEERFMIDDGNSETESAALEKTGESGVYLIYLNKLSELNRHIFRT